MSLAFYVILVLFLVAFSGVLSAAETAFVAASNPRLLRSARAGNKAAGRVLKLRKRMARLLGGLLIANTLNNSLASAVTTHLFTQALGESGMLVATAMMTVILVIFAEVLPKTIALNFPERFTFFSVPFVNALFFVVSPLVQWIEWLVSSLLRVIGVRVRSNFESTISVEDLRGFIDSHQGASSKEAQERAMLKSILDLADVKIAEIMIHRKNVLMLNLNDAPAKILQEVLKSPYSRIPVVRGSADEIVGIMHTKRYLHALADAGNNPSKVVLEDVTDKPWFIPETTTLLDQLQAFRQRCKHFAIVVDEYGSFEGIVCLEDILEEIVGEINDEFDVESEDAVPTQDGGYLVEGATTIRDLNRQFDWSLSDKNASTLAGVLLYESRSIPAVGQAYMIQGFRIRVLRRVRNQITLLKVTPPARKEEIL
ncbi:MAG: DUF21 domain-containing protein [Alphaproteobacteria bacterium]|nr:MAG: DUF21 domain-containing protein [Alphaproteobacteria bacterium]